MPLTGRGQMIRSAWLQKKLSRNKYATQDLTQLEFYGNASLADKLMWNDWFFRAAAAPPATGIPILLMAPLMPPLTVRR